MGVKINQWRGAVKKITPDSSLIAIFDFKDFLSTLNSHLSLTEITDRSKHPPPLLFHVSDITLRIFTYSGDTFITEGREKASLPSELIFPSNILQQKLLEVECVQVGRLSNRLWRGDVRHTQTSLMPCAVICQHELWSRIILKLRVESMLSHACFCCFFLLVPKKKVMIFLQLPKNSLFLMSFCVSLLFLPPQASVEHVKVFSVTQVEFPHRQKAPT